MKVKVLSTSARNEGQGILSLMLEMKVKVLSISARNEGQGFQHFIFFFVCLM